MNSYFIWQLIIVSALLVAGPVKADGDINAGQEKSTSCAGCHGSEGEGVGENPALAGLDSEVLVSAMQAYKTGERTEPMMAMLMQALSDEDIADLAAYYASLSNCSKE